MKRVSLVLLGIVGAAAVAGAAAVKSVNAVGFVKQTLPSGFNLCSFNWDKVGGNEGMPIGDLFGDQLTGDASLLSADNLIMWNATAQTYVTFWKYDDGSFKMWLDEEGNEATNVLHNGDGFWVLNRHGAQDVTFLGQVVDVGTNSLDLVQGFNFFGFPFSADKKLTETDLSNDGVHGDVSLLSADNIIAWNRDTQNYETYWLYDDGSFRMWLTEAGEEADPTLAMGEGFWYLRRVANTLTWTEPQPYSLDN